LGFIIQKEFIQIFRNKAILPLMTVAPIVQLIVLSFAANNEVKNVRLAIVDLDQSQTARQLIQRVQASDRFILGHFPRDPIVAEQLMQAGEVDILLTIPLGFETELFRYRGSALQLVSNAINGQQSTVGMGYLQAILSQFNQEIREDASATAVRMVKPLQIRTETSNWYNPDLSYKYFMVPGILGELVTILVILLTAMNVVREREIGTIEQINVTPIRKWQFILGKMIPFLLIGIFLLVIGLTAGKLIFDIPMRGNLFLVFVFCLLNLTAVLGLGLLISNVSDTQQQAMFVTFFFVMIFVLMSGLFTPIESMPQWAQHLTIPNPIAHFVHVMRSVLLKGSGWSDLAFNFQAMGVMALLFNGLAIFTYRKVN
ncbi:MAG: ABC transporter permease, partial [Bacteroidota bacterium]